MFHTRLWMRKVISVTAAVVSLGFASADGIVGGRAADPGEYPWMAALYRGSDPSDGVCGGSLVRPTLVVTAAHCVLELVDDTAANVADDLLGFKMRVLLGRSTLSGPGGEVIEAKDVHRYPLGGPSVLGGRGDIAVIELARPSVQQTIDWAKPEDAELYAAGVLATIIGWGATSEDGSDPVDPLMEAELPIVSDASCQKSYDETPYGALFDARVELCAGRPEGGVDTCSGDSGGPLMVPKPGGGFLLAGIASWGEGCARPNRPGVYAEVAAFADFIEQHL